MRTIRIACAALAAAVLVSSPAAARWSHDPAVSLEVHPSTGFVPSYVGTGSGAEAVRDGSGGLIVAYTTAGVSDQDIRAQRFDHFGNKLWGSTGVAICTATGNPGRIVVLPDVRGGALIAWEDYRSGNSDIYAQSVNANGVTTWTSNGVLVCGAAGDQVELTAATDLFSNLLLAWTDKRNAADWDVYGALLYANGVALTPANGISLVSATGQQTQPAIAVSPSEGGIVAWRDARTDAGDIYANCISWGGFASWGTNGVALSTAVGSQFAPTICADNSNGSVVAWTDTRSGFDIYARRVQGGIGYWASDGLPVCTDGSSQTSPRIVNDLAGGVVIAWTDSRPGGGLSDVYAQRLDPFYGLAQWATDGVPVASGLQQQALPAVVADGFGGTIVAFEDYRASGTPYYSAQRLSDSGVRQWGNGGTLLASGTSAPHAFLLVPDTQGGAYFVFEDFLTPVSANHAGVQHVDRWGFLGAEPWVTDVADVPNDQGGRVKVSWDASPLDTDPAFENIGGYYVFRSAPASLVANALRAGAVTTRGEDAAAAAMRRQPLLLAVPNGTNTSYWEFVGSQNAYHLPSYSFLAATTGDSIAGSNPLTSYMVQAFSYYGWHWESPPDSGYSVDDLAPAAPAPFTGLYASGSSLLQWGANLESDLANYRLYRGHGLGFTPSLANRIAEPNVLTFSDPAGAPFVYKLTAVDTHGNESPATTLIPDGVLAVDDGVAVPLFLAPPSPNPLRGSGALVRFGLPAASRVTLGVFDAAGRRVRRIADAGFGPGEHALRFDGRDDAGRTLAAGLYFLRLESAFGSRSARLAAIE